MAKKKIELYYPTLSEIKAMTYCVGKNVAYAIEANRNKKFYILKYIPSHYNKVKYLEENNKKVEFSEYEATKKIMELYINQSKML